jgi:subtilisin-like proprotein convertase family protein
MKIARISLVAVALCGALLIPQLATAQEKVPDVEDNFVPGGGGIPIPDNGYDGTLGSMACITTTVGAGTVTGVDVDLAVDHTWIGDLTVKVASPMGTIVTLMSRPGFDDTADDGTGCCGDSSNMVNTSPINYADANTFDAEQMGATIDGASFVCQDDGECDFFPNPGSGPGINLADFNGEAAAGDWQVCVGDSVGADPGTLFVGTANVAVAVPTVGQIGLLLLLILLASGSIFVLRR